MNKTVFFNKFRRLFGFVLTISLLGNVFAASAQNARISIKMENVPISQVIKEIENQTRYLFINKGVDTKNKVSINAVQKTIQDVLAQLFAGTEIAYRIDESYIILTKKNDAGNPVSVTGKIRDAKGNPIVGASILVQGTTIGVSSDAMVRLRFRYPPPQQTDSWKSVLLVILLCLLSWAAGLLSKSRSKRLRPRSSRSWSLLLVLSVRKRP